MSVPAVASDRTVVVEWNNALLQAVRDTSFAPVLAARALAITHTCMFDAWAAYDAKAVGTRLGGSLRRPVKERTAANKAKAVSFAAYRALTDLFPAQQAGVFDALMARLGYDPLDTSVDVTTPSGIGNVACQAVLAMRHDDGSNQLGDRNGGAPYSDYTDYTPVNTPTELIDPNRWQPLLNPDGVTAQKFLTPHWRLVTPFALSAPDQFAPELDPAALHPGATYTEQVDEIVSFSANLTDRQKMIASYWADGPRTETPPGHWNLFAQYVSRRDRHSLDKDVRMFFALGNALLDASIAVWDCKVAFDYVRPITAVRFLYADQTIQAWGGPGKGTVSMLGENFRPYIGTPPFAEFTSGHSAFSAAAAQILRLFTGSDVLLAAVTFPPGSSPIEPGIVPATRVTLAWLKFSDAADQAGLSRRYGGIHFREGDLDSRLLGRQIGQLVWTKALRYFNGTIVASAG
jgi:hypothetical protein